MEMSKKLKAEIHGIKNASEDEKEFYKESVDLLIKVLQDKEFWIYFEPFYTTSLYKGEFKTYQSFKNRIFSGIDRFNKEEDNDLDFYVTMYYSSKNVIGYTYPSTWKTWFNRKYKDRFNIAEMAGHIFHEYLHNVGLDHPNTNRKSLIYKAGYAVRDYGEEILGIENKPVYYKPKQNIFRRVWNWIRRIF